MVITPTSILSCMAGSALLTLLAWAILRNGSMRKYVGRYISLLLAAIILRMALPVEFRFTRSFYSEHVMTLVMDILTFEIGIGSHSLSIFQAFSILWGLGAACRLLTTVKGYLQLSYAARRLPGYFKKDLRPIMDRVNSEHGKHKSFQALLMPGIGTPAIFGLVHPKILMPETEYTEDELYYILKHEMLHFYKHDMAVKVFCEILCIIYWWNPCIFLVRSLVTKTIELNVDHSVTCHFDDMEKDNYLKCILKSMKAARTAKTNLVITFSSQKSSAMMQRFQCISENQWNTGSLKGAFVSALIALLFCLSLLTIVEPRYDSNIPGTFHEPTPKTSYLVKTNSYYKIYVDGEHVGNVHEITEPLFGLEIYELEDVPNE